MRTFISYIMVTMLMFGLVVNDVSAKRFGAGRSFGVQRSTSSFSSFNTSQNKSFTQKSNNRSKWGGILGGLLVGGLLASLFMGHGVGAGLLSWLVIGVLAFFLIGLFRKKMQPGANTHAFSGFQANNSNPISDFFSGNRCANDVNEPVNFDADAFLREAKVQFIRLQAAYDQKNRQDLSQFTAPEVFAEIEMQLNERGDEPNHTEVVSLNTQLLDVAEQGDSVIASVRFTGVIKENNHSVSLDETWHFRKFVGTTNWVVGGIAQN